MLDVSRLSRTIADRLQERIIREGMEPGDQLPTEPQLMQEFGVSRTVVREGAALLVSRGVVDVRPRRGMTVRAPDGQGLAESLAAQLRMSRVSLPQLLQVRITLECAIARLAAANRTETEVAALERNLVSMKEAHLDPVGLVELDLQFHDLMASATHNPFFLLMMRPINELLRSFYTEKAGYVMLLEKTLAEHGRILEAVRAADEEEADSATKAHLNRIGQSAQLFVGMDGQRA